MRSARAIAIASTFVLSAWACGDSNRGSPAQEDDAGPPPPAPPPPPADDASTDAGDAGADPKPAHDAADAALEALLLGFWSGADGYLHATRDAASAKTGYWIFAQTLDAILDAATRTKGRFASAIETFYLAQDAIGWSRSYFDDENWMALALLRAYDLTGRQKYLDRATSLFDDIVQNAQDSTCCGATPGGLWWDTAHTQKATAANAGAIVTGARLAKRTGKTSYLDFAKTVWSYWDAHMVDPATHAVSDHLDAPGGNVVKYKFTYNEGIMIGAALALFDATGDKTYLDEAHAIAGYMVASETMGDVLFDGNETSCTGDCPMFKGIGYRWLAALHAADARPAYANVLAKSQTELLSVALDKTTGNFGIDWTAPPGKLVVEASASAAMALSIFAAAQGAYVDARDPLAYQAEEAVLHGVGLEAKYGNFDGWAYVAGWNADGQGIDFETKTTAGNYLVTIRYAAGAGTASRRILVDGVEVVADQTFATAGGWDIYGQVSLPMALGANGTISIVYDAATGSHQFLNVDRILLKKL